MVEPRASPPCVSTRQRTAGNAAAERPGPADPGGCGEQQSSTRGADGCGPASEGKAGCGPMRRRSSTSSNKRRGSETWPEQPRRRGGRRGRWEAGTQDAPPGRRGRPLRRRDLAGGAGAGAALGRRGEDRRAGTTVGRLRGPAGMGDVVSARMAVEDGAGACSACLWTWSTATSNRPDVGMGIARRWYDQEKVDAIFGIGNSASRSRVQQLTRGEKNRVNVSVAAGTTDLTGRAARDSASTGPTTITPSPAARRRPWWGEGKRRWFFITSDYAFGHSLEQNGTEDRARARRRGGRLRSRRRSRDRLLQPHRARGAVRRAGGGLAVSGTDLINAVKQMGEFGLMRRGYSPRPCCAS